MIELPEPDVLCDCGGDYYTADAVRDAMQRERDRFRRLVLDDAWAMTFQTFGQYRTALAKAMGAEMSKEPT